jgi:hypothetical protein
VDSPRLLQRVFQHFWILHFVSPVSTWQFQKMMEEYNTDLRVVERRLGILTFRIEDAIADDSRFGRHLDQIASQCRQSLKLKTNHTRERTERQYHDPRFSLEQDAPSHASSLTDTTGSVCGIRDGRFEETADTMKSERVLQQSEPKEFGSPISSFRSGSQSRRALFIRSVAKAREQHVRDVMTVIKERINRRGSA